MKKSLAVIALSALLATPAFADSPADTEGGLVMKMKGITLDIGGFIESATIYRSRNEMADINSTFGLPKPTQSNYYQDETRFSARQSRLSILATGNATPSIHLAGYYEMDFLGAAQSANEKESNSYNLRVRHLYTTADWDNLGLHLLAGQAWSLVTLNNNGITPRNEVTPQTIDAQYVPGFTWARQAQLRIVKDFDKTLWLAASIENPQTVSASNPAANTALNITPNSGLGTTGVSQNSIPDVVFKAAYEPGWGHFEVYDLIRSFDTTIANGTSNTTTNAVGGGVVLPLVPKMLTLQVSGVYGRGLGRYGSGQLADVTVDATNHVVPISEVQFLTGLLYNPTADWNFYAYYGLEQAERLNLGATTATGYGNAGLNTNWGGAFAGQIQRVDQATVGLWWKFLQGSFGRMQAGLQYSYTENKYFRGTAGAPDTTDNMLFTSIRYYWQ